MSGTETTTNAGSNIVGVLIKLNRQQLAQRLQDDPHSFLFSLGTITNSGSWAIIKNGDGTVQNLFVTDIA